MPIKPPLRVRLSTLAWEWPIIGPALQRRQGRIFRREFIQAGMTAGELVPEDGRTLRRATDAQLHAMLADNTARPAERIALEREQRRRDAWATPAGRAYWLSLASLVIAIGALIVSILNAVK